jgi:hypothetical protein
MYTVEPTVDLRRVPIPSVRRTVCEKDSASRRLHKDRNAAHPGACFQLPRRIATHLRTSRSSGTPSFALTTNPAGDASQ